jgi:DNA-binding NtrC family response regulator
MTMRKPVLLLVDGDIVVRHNLAEYLRECGFTVIEAASGEDAMRVLVIPELRIQIVLTDLATTGGGFALSQRIKAAGMDVDIILAGTIEQAVKQAGQVCNEGPALAKPYQHHLVLEQIKRAISARGRQNA